MQYIYVKCRCFVFDFQYAYHKSREISGEQAIQMTCLAARSLHLG